MSSWKDKQEAAQGYAEYAGIATVPSTDSSKKEKANSYPARPIMGLYDTFAFGKHGGKKLEGVVDTYPGYIAWLIKNNVVEFDEEVIELIEELGIL